MLGMVSVSLFVLSVVALSATPGPDTAFIVGRSVSAGRTAGVVSALGISAGCCVHLSATVLGLTAILAASAQAFTVIKWVGAAYLIYLGTRMLFARQSTRASGKPDTANPASATIGTAATAATSATADLAARPKVVNPPSLRRVFVQGIWTNLLNPKVVLFFVAFFPQFVAPDAAHKTWAFLVLGIVFIGISTLSNCFVAFVAGTLSRRLGASPRANSLVDRIVGGAFVGLGVRLALLNR